MIIFRIYLLTCLFLSTERRVGHFQIYLPLRNMNTSLRSPEICQTFLSYVLTMIYSHLNLPQLQSKQLSYAMRSAMSDSLGTHRLQTTRLLCPWNFPGKKYWSGFPFPTPGNLPNPGIKSTSLMSPALQVDSLPPSHLGSPNNQQKTMIQQNWDNIVEENAKLF